MLRIVLPNSPRDSSLIFGHHHETTTVLVSVVQHRTAPDELDKSPLAFRSVSTNPTCNKFEPASDLTKEETPFYMLVSEPYHPSPFGHRLLFANRIFTHKCCFCKWWCSDESVSSPRTDNEHFNNIGQIGGTCLEYQSVVSPLDTKRTASCYSSKCYTGSRDNN